jgi:prepilin-type processing-associated H-X9-DG protein
VELLVVIGIIALLVSILLPSLNRAREAAKQTKCLSNLKQIGYAMMMYVNDNQGMLPFDALATHHDEDFIWWQPANFKDLNIGGLGPYLKVTSTNYDVLLCPSDDVASHQRNNPTYPFSYALNWMTTSDSNAPIQGQEGKLSAIRDTPNKVLMLEEDERTIDDGNASIWLTSGGWGSINLLAIRHDHTRHLPDNFVAPIQSKNIDCRGNVLFCDGHAEYVSRRICHAKSYAVPHPEVFPNDPELGP